MHAGRHRHVTAGMIAGLALALAMVTACGGAPAPGTSSRSRPTPAPSLVPLATWQQKGATEAPPSSVQRVSLQSIEVVNQAGASDGDARAWAAAFLRARNYELWAVSRGQDGFLLHSGLSSAPVAIFASDFSDLAQARQAGDSVQYTPHVIRRLVLRAVPDSMRASFTGAGFTLTRFAWFLDAVGPAYTYWIDRQGQRTVKAQLPAGAAAYELVGGTFSHDPVLGDVWVLASDFDCTAAGARQAVTSLCNP